MTNDREFCRNVQNDYLIHVLTQLPDPRRTKTLARKRAFAGSLELIRAIAGKDVPRGSNVPRRRKARTTTK